MDELHEFCARMLGDREAAARAIQRVRQDHVADHLQELARAVTACRQLAGDDASSPEPVSGPPEPARGLPEPAPALPEPAPALPEPAPALPDPASRQTEPASGVARPASGLPDLDSSAGRAPAETIADELASATARLPQRQREALALGELLRLSHDQVGSVIGIDSAAVASLLARARLRLRQELRGTGAVAAPCPDRDRALPTIARRQDREDVSPEDDDWLLEHLGQCVGCSQAHAAMLEASACYRAWRIPASPA